MHLQLWAGDLRKVLINNPTIDLVRNVFRHPLSEYSSLKRGKQGVCVCVGVCVRACVRERWRGGIGFIRKYVLFKRL